MLNNDVAPLKYRIYKGIGGQFGAAQFTLNQPLFYCSKNKKHKFFVGDLVRRANFSSNVKCTYESCDGVLGAREGNIFLEMTVATGPNKYDWNQKISFCLSIKDIGTLLVAMKKAKSTDLTHDPGAGTNRKGQITKKLIYEVKNKEKGALLSLYEKKREEEKGRRVMVPLSLDEVFVLAELFKTALSSMVAWI